MNHQTELLDALKEAAAALATIANRSSKDSLERHLSVATVRSFALGAFYRARDAINKAEGNENESETNRT